MVSVLRSPHSHSTFDPATDRAPRFYFLTDLGRHPEGAPLLPTALNERGDICVCATGPRPAGVMRGFCLTGGEMLAAGLAFGQAPATCLGNTGLVGGAAGTAPLALRAWNSALGVFGESLWPGSSSVVRGINRHGHMTGNVLFDAGSFSLSQAFVMRTAGPAKFVTPPGGGTSVAAAINDQGDVLFNAAPLAAPAGETHAWLLADEHYTAITSLGGGRTWATGLTPQGRVVGHALTADDETHGFFWEDGHTTDLGAPAGCMTQALAANDQRTVVGKIVDPHAGPRAFRWTPDTGLLPLEEFVAAPHGWVLHEAVAINRDGVIVGSGTFRGSPRGFVLHPISAS